MSLENLQTLSKLKRNMRAQLFFKQNMRAATQKKLCTHIFFEFGKILEILQTRSKLIYFYFFKFHLFWGEKRNEFGKLDPNSNDFMFYCVFPLLFFHVCLEKAHDFGVSLEILQTLSKLTPNSLQTHMFSFFMLLFSFSIYIYFWTRGMSLEWVWRFSKLSPNSYVFFYYFIFSLEKTNEFGVTLEILQILSKLSPNSPQTRSKLKGFHFFYFTLFFWKRGMSLERVWRVSKLSPNSLQTHVFFCYVTTEETASPGSPAKLS